MPSSDKKDNSEDILEPWTEWIQRATRHVEQQLRKLNIESWVHTARRKQWQWAQKVMTLTNTRWARRAIQWEPVLTTKTAHRAVGHPRKRWDDDIQRYIDAKIENGVNWKVICKDEYLWSELEDDFVHRGEHQVPK